MRIVLGIEYDGSGYCGWQRQDGVQTVQECVEAALSIVADHPVAVVCAGRTDAGVHATGQVVHFDSEAGRSMRSWVLGANANLPDDVSVLWARPVDAGFHARFSAHARSYRYIILNRMTRPALQQKRVCWEYRLLDHDAMNDAAQELVGEYDFSTFRAVACQAKHPVREVFALNIGRSGDCVYLDISANAFLHHMVRNIAGALIAVGKGDRDRAWVREVLHARDRTVGGVTASAQGLYFVAVKYPESYNLPSPQGTASADLESWSIGPRPSPQ